MAITPATTYDVVPVESTIGQTNFRNDPLRAILENTNYFYAHHRPPLANFMGIGAAGTQNTYYYPVTPSADVLDYTVYIHYYSATPTTNTTLTVKTSTSSTTGAWTANSTDTWASAAAEWRVTDTQLTLAADVQYLEIQLTSAVNCQLHSCIIYPTPITSIAVAEQASGFIAFDSTHLDDGSGVAVHTEYFNRAKANVRSVLRDRYQAVWSFCNNVDRPDVFLDPGQVLHQIVAVAQSSMIGQAGATVNVHARIDSDGSGATTDFFELDSSLAMSTAFTDEGDDQSRTLVIKTDKPAFKALCTPASNRETPIYICVDWRPGD